MNMDDKVFCSLQCFNDLNPPSGEVPVRRDEGGVADLADSSAPDLPLTLEDPASEPTVILPAANPLDEYSDVVLGMHAAAHTIAPPAPTPDIPTPLPVLDSDSSVILSAHASHEVSDTNILAMDPVRSSMGDGSSTLILVPGTRRSLISSSCFFHPDTSAIVLCARCRNPICSLCAQETPEGLTCTPSCGPADLAGVRQRRKITTLNLLLAASVVIVVTGAGLLLRAWHVSSEKLALQLADLKASSTPAPHSSGPPAQSPPLTREPAAAPGAAEAPPAPVTSPLLNSGQAKPASSGPPREPRPVSPAPVKPAPAKAAATEPARPVLAASERTPAEPRRVVVPPAAPPAPVLPRTEAPAVAAPAGIRPAAEPPPAAVHPPAPPSPTPYQLDVRTAARLLRETEPILRETAEQMYPELKPNADVGRLIDLLQKGVDNLLETRDLYTQWLDTAPDRVVLERRLERIAGVIKDLYVGLDRLRSDPRAPKHSSP